MCYRNVISRLCSRRYHVPPGVVVGDLFKKLDFSCGEFDLISAIKCLKALRLDVGPRYLSLMKACGEAKALVEAKAVHRHSLTYAAPVSISMFNCIIEMYGRCGSMDDAYNTFKTMPIRNLTSWDNMVSWYARNGLGEEAIDLFIDFEKTGLKPDGQLFLAVFDACGVAGDVGEGLFYFYSMSDIYGITPTMEHYASIVRMFGNACDLEGALEFIENMPVEPNVDVWESLMWVSRMHGNVELGERCAQIIDELDPLRLTIEAKSGLLPSKDSLIKRKVKKAGLLEAMNHKFRAGDKSHPDSENIYALLRGLKEHLKEPEISFGVEKEENKEEAVMVHSCEELAAAYGLLTSAPRSYLYLMKNNSVFEDNHSHNMFKKLSKLAGRKIVLLAKSFYHHFEDGECSCEHIDKSRKR